MTQASTLLPNVLRAHILPERNYLFVKIVLGNWSQFDHSTNANHQCVAIATTAFACTISNPVFSWDTSHIDAILMNGQQYYNECMTFLRDPIHGDLVEHSYRGSILIIASHEDHIHVIHDCTYTCSTCRCARLRAIGLLARRVKRRNRGSDTFTSSHFENLLSYLSQESRHHDYVEIAGQTWIFNCEVKHMPLRKSEGNSNNGALYDDTMVSDLFGSKFCGFDTTESEPSIYGDNVSCKTNSRRSQGEKTKLLYQFIKAHPTSPLKGVFMLPAES